MPNHARGFLSSLPPSAAGLRQVAEAAEQDAVTARRGGLLGQRPLAFGKRTPDERRNVDDEERKAGVHISGHRATIKWSRCGADFAYKNYSRDHVWRFGDGVEVQGSATPEFLSNPHRVDPESAFVAALSSRHMLTFLALVSNKGFVVESYEDNAIGFLEKNVSGKLAVTQVDLRPFIVFSGDVRPAQTTSTGCMPKHVANAASPTRSRPRSASNWPASRVVGRRRTAPRIRTRG